MNHSKAQQTQDHEKLSVPMPGDGLKEARTRQGLSIGEVAKHLNLLADLIEAIETNTSTEKTSLAYARGYTLNYARLLELDVDKVAAQFDHHFGSTQHHLRQRQEQQQDEQANAYLAWLLYVAIIILVIAGVWYFFPDTDQSENQPSNDSMSGVEQPIAIDSTIDDIPIGLPQEDVSALTQTDKPQVLTEFTDQANQISPPIADTSDVSDPVDASLNAPSVEPNGATDQQTNDQEQAQSSSEEQVLGTEDLDTELTQTADRVVAESVPVETDTAVSPRVVNTEQVAQTKDQLLFNLRQGTWIKITDANQTVLYAQTRDTLGEFKLDLDGQAPYEIVLGNAPGVSLEYNGQVIDISIYTSQLTNVARFTVGR